MKRYVICFFLFVSLCLFSQDFNIGISPKHKFYTEIEYEWVNGMVIMPVEIEGELYRFILDTGAPVVISDELNNKLGHQTISNIPIEDSSGKVDSMHHVVLSSVSIGGVEYQNIPTIVSKNFSDSILNCFNVDGFIGSNLLRKSIVQIDPLKHVLRITNQRKKLELKKKNATKLRFLQ